MEPEEKTIFLSCHTDSRRYIVNRFQLVLKSYCTVFRDAMNSKPFIWAHRGASGAAPENTLAAFKLAEQSGADGIELDVHLSRDGVPVVMHDETVNRTTDGRGAVADFTLRELRRLDAGRWFSPDFCGEPVPTLADVLTWAEDRIRINVEIKTASAGRAVLEVLSEFPQARVLVSSFYHGLLLLIRQWSPELPIGFLVDSRFWRVALNRAIECGAESFHPPAQHVNRILLRKCHDEGLVVYPWTVDDRSRQNNFLRMGADGLFTNFPGKVGILD